MSNEKVIKAYVVRSLPDGTIPVALGTECQILSDTIDEARIRFDDWLKGAQTMVVSKHILGIDLSNSEIYTDEPSYRAM